MKLVKFQWEYNEKGKVTNLTPLEPVTRQDCDQAVNALANISLAIQDLKKTLPQVTRADDRLPPAGGVDPQAILLTLPVQDPESA